MNKLSAKAHYSDNAAADLISEDLVKHFNEKTLIVCIGTDKCIGDSLGPLIGTFLVKNNFPYPVIGTLENPVHAINIDSTVKEIKEKYPGYHVIAVDACIGYEECVGDIQIKIGPVSPGKGVGKSLPQVGDISIYGIVDSIDNADIFSIKNIRLNFIMNMAEVISKSLINAANKTVNEAAVTAVN